MKQRRFMAVTAAVAVIVGTIGLAAPAAAAPPTAPWGGSAGGEVANLTTAAVGLNLAALGVAVSDSDAGSTLAPRASSVSSNVSADVAGLGIAVVSNDQTAPPDAGGPEAGTLLGVTVPTLLDIGALDTINEAHWDVDTACVTDGVLASSTTQTAGLSLLPLLGGGVLELGVSQTTGETGLVQNAGLNYGVQSTATGTITGLSLIGGAIDVAVAGDTTLTATATGNSAGTVEYAPATVTVTVPSLGIDEVLTPGASLPITIAGIADVTITMNEPSVTTTATSATATSSLLSIDIDVLGVFPLPPVATASVDILPLSASATAPAGGIDCPPAAPVILVPADGATTNATPTISGTADPNASVEVFVDGTSIGTVPADGDGDWTITAPTLTEGAHVATAVQTVTGITSATSAPVDFTVDATAPPAPVITSPTDGALLNDSTPTFAGTAEANTTIEVFVDGVSIGTAPVDGTGNWTLTAAAPLADGPHTAVATATDAVGNESPDSNEVAFTIDATVPAPPVITAPVDGEVTSDPTPPIAGTAEPNAFVTIFIDGSAVGATSANSAGDWSLTPITPLADGHHTVVATATDAADNVSADSNEVAFIVDTVIPAAPVITAPADGSSTNDVTPDIAGTAEPESTVTVTIDGVVAGTTETDGTGNWTFTPGTALAPGPHTAVATATDAAGNESADSNTVTFTIDTTAPAAPVITDPVDGSSTNDTTPDIAGTAEPDATVEVFIDGVSVGTTDADGTGNWTLPLTAPLADGPHTAVATATDAAGNTGPDSAEVTFTVDTADPAPPVITSPVEGSTTNDPTPPITGIAEPNSTVTVIVDGVTLGTTPVDGGGAWSFTPTDPLDDGTHSVTATATDAAGNVSPGATPVTFTVDTAVPAAPVIDSPADGSSTNDPTPPISGSAEPNSTVTVIVDGASIGTTPADVNGDWSLTPTTPLAPGPHTVTATATDAGGNVSPESAEVTFTIDVAAPAAPVVTTPADGSVTSDTTPPVTGTAEPGATVTVSIDGAVVGTTAADDTTGAWTFQTTIALSQGAHTVNATATDEAGNTGPVSNTNTFTVDSLAPLAPEITAPTDGSSTNVNTPLITGTAEPDTTVTVTIDGTVVGTAPVDGTGAWSFPSPVLADGPHTVSATSTDAAGNVSPPSDEVTFTVDTDAPAAPVVTSPADGDVVSDATPAITGTAEPNTTVTVIVDGATIGTAPSGPLGVWTITSPTLTEGSHTVSAFATDAAGNVGPASATNTFVVDLTAPAAPVITSPADGSSTTDSTPPITGTAEPGTTVTVRVDGAVIGTALADETTGAWSVTPTTPLADGPHTATATATDEAGNVSPPSEAVTFTVDANAPAAPVITSPEDGSSTNDPTPPITGTAEPGSTVTVSIDGAEVGTADADDTTGEWTFQPTTPLAEGDHTVSATATDDLGNTGPAASVDFTVDTTPPAAPVITSPADGSTTDDATPPITGTAEPGSTVTVIVDGQPIGTADVDENGDWTFLPTAPLPNGDHTISATATDAAGNTGPESEAVTVTIAAPAAGDGELPTTGGGSPWTALLLGSLLVSAGAWLVTARRRRV